MTIERGAVTPSERDVEMAAQVLAGEHCRYCNWVDDTSVYAKPMKCKDDFADLHESVAQAIAQARAEGAKEERAAVLAFVNEIDWTKATNKIANWLEAREGEA